MVVGIIIFAILLVPIGMAFYDSIKYREVNNYIRGVKKFGEPGPSEQELHERMVEMGREENEAFERSRHIDLESDYDYDDY